MAAGYKKCFAVGFLGHKDTGCLSLILRLRDNKWYESTFIAGIAFQWPVLTYAWQNETYKVKIMDSITGREAIGWKYPPRGNNEHSSFRYAHLYVICFDLNDHDAFRKLMTIVENNMRFLVNKKLLLVGTKADVTLDHQVTKDHILEFQNMLPNMPPYIETSAKTGAGCNEILPTIMSLLVDAEPVSSLCSIQ